MGSNEQVNKNTTPQETLISILPKGWRREEIIRKSGISAGKTDVTYYRYLIKLSIKLQLINSNILSSTDGKKFKTKLEMQQFLGDKYDLSLFDYKTGKQSTVVLRKQKRLRNPVYLTKSLIILIKILSE
jgi:methyl-CpG-binding domain protein 2